MFYYKTYYLDGTWAYVKSKKPLMPKAVCNTCVWLEKKSAWWYWRNRIIYGKC